MGILGLCTVHEFYMFDFKRRGNLGHGQALRALSIRIFGNLVSVSVQNSTLVTSKVSQNAQAQDSQG